MPNFPAQPTIFDTTYAAPTGTVTTVHSGGDLQAAIDAATPNSIIQIDVNFTGTGPYILRNKGANTNWIYIQSTNYASLPAPGVRVGPGDAINMPTLQASGTNSVFVCEAGANHYRLVGLHITTTVTDQSVSGQNLIVIDAPFPGNQQLSDIPDHMFVDRCYLHGNPTGNCERGVTMHGSNVAVIDSYISDIHEVGREAQALACWNGPGPFMITNDYLEAAGQGILFGGDDPRITNLVPSDVYVADCRFAKLLKWFPGDPTYAGITWTVKNIFELKNAQRVLVGGCTMDYCWADAQNGYAILFTVRNQDISISAPWSTVQDVTFQNNIVRHVGGGINIEGTDNLHPSQTAARIWIRKNQFIDINNVWQEPPNALATGRAIQIAASPGGPADLIIEHNTMLSTNVGIIITNYDGSSNVYTFPNFIYRNNICEFGVFGDLGTGNDATALGAWAPGYIYAGNVVSQGNINTLPAGNFVAANDGAIGFIDLANQNLGLAPTSPFKFKATDGFDPGAVQQPFNFASGTFATSPIYQGPHRRDASLVVPFQASIPAVTPAPPLIRMAQTPEPLFVPRRDANYVCLTANVTSQVRATLAATRQAFTNDAQVAPYRTVINMIRGRTSDQVNVAPVPNPPAFATTDPRAWAFAIPDASLFMPTPGPVMLQYDPLAGGAFMTTPVRWRNIFPASDASDTFAPPGAHGPTIEVSQRAFAMVFFYRRPHLQDSSWYVVTPATFGGITPTNPGQLFRFVNLEWSARLRGATYPTDASLWLPPQALVRIVSPPTQIKRRYPQWMRRLELMNLRPAPHWMPGEGNEW